MARIAGVDIPNNKRGEVSLTYIYGIGVNRSREILISAGVDLNKKVGTSIICGGPFNSGVLVGRKMWNYSNATNEILNKVKLLSKVADNYNVPLPAAALQFPLFNKIISSVIPGARSKNEYQQILEWFQFEIPSDFWHELKSKKLIDSSAPICE